MPRLQQADLPARHREDLPVALEQLYRKLSRLSRIRARTCFRKEYWVTPPDVLRSDFVVHGFFKGGQTCLHVFEFDCFRGMVQDAVCRSHTAGSRRVRVNHDLAKRRYGGGRHLLQASHRLGERSTPRLQISCFESGLIQPTVERAGWPIDSPCRLLDTALGQEGDDGLFLRAPELESRSCHYSLANRPLAASY